MKLLDSGETLEKLRETLGVSISAMEEWRKKERNGESLANKELNRKPRKFQDEKVKKLIEENPDITLVQIAEHFKGSVGGAFNACARCKITIKKKK